MIHSVNQAIFNYNTFPDEMKGWLNYRIEYCFNVCGWSDREGHIYLPPDKEIHEDFEKLLSKINTFLKKEQNNEPADAAGVSGAR